MKLLFKQRMFAWFDSYDIFDELGNTVYTVKGEPAWGHKLKIFGADGREVGTVKQKLFAMMPTFELYNGEEYIGSIHRKFTPFKPSYEVDYNGWQVKGSFMEWDYSIQGPGGEPVATISKELLHWTDTYVIDVVDSKDALCALMFVLAIDAEKCSRAD